MQIRVIFLFEFKVNHEAAETTHNISSIFGPKTAKEWMYMQW